VAVLPETDERHRAGREPIESLRGEPLLVQQDAVAARTLLDSACHVAGFEPLVKAESRYASTLVALGESGSGLPIMFDYVLETTNGGAGAPITDARGGLRTPVWLAWRKGWVLLPAVAEARALVAAGTTARRRR
jgi:hypothetical protein